MNKGESDGWGRSPRDQIIQEQISQGEKFHFDFKCDGETVKQFKQMKDIFWGIPWQSSG